MKKIFHILMAVGILLTAGCQGASVSATSSSTPVQPTATPPKEIVPQSPSQVSESMEDGVNMPDPTIAPNSTDLMVVQIAINDLAQRLQISADQIKVSALEAVTWPDTSLGCPKMGVMYTQVLTPGYKIVLETQGKKYPYHTDSSKQVVLCALQPGVEQFFSPTP